ncbi:MAG: hypothetical protein GY719_31465 [bacterium]|nr:hypothetical protein [bacterium]
MRQQKPRYFQLLQLLSSHDVDFIVVGGVAAILEGAPITTLDLDIVYERSGENLERLMEVLRTVKASYRDPAGRHIVPTVDRLATNRMNLLKTDLGPLDVIASISGADYEDLLESTRTRQVAELRLQVLELAKVIETKELANRDKDRAVLPVLRKTLELKAQ